MIKRIFKKITLFSLSFFVVCTPFGLVLAADNGKGGSTNNGSGGSSDNGKGGNSQGIVDPLNGNSDLPGFLAKILHIIVILGAIVVVFYIIYAGLQYVLARGDEAAIKKAHQTLTWTVIGAAILLGAEVISKVIQTTVQQLAQ